MHALVQAVTYMYTWASILVSQKRISCEEQHLLTKLMPLNYVLLCCRYGGWLGGQVVNDFAYYAQTLYSRFGDKVRQQLESSVSCVCS
jgi:hypothetical protein